MHILNRSPDPVPAAKVNLSGFVVFEKFDGHFPKGKFHRAEVSAPTSRLAPCTELIYSPRQIAGYWIRGLKDPVWRPNSQLFVSRIVTTEFTDRDGRSWWRTSAGLKRGRPPLRQHHEWENDLRDDPVVKRAASCDRDE